MLFRSYFHLTIIIQTNLVSNEREITELSINVYLYWVINRNKRYRAEQPCYKTSLTRASKFLNMDIDLFVAMKRCQIAAKIAGSIGILPCCVSTIFSHRGMNVCPMCEASLNHHTLYNEDFGPHVYMYHVFLCWQNKTTKNAPILKPANDQTPDTFLA